MRVENGKAILTFDNTASGLTTKGDRLEGFEIAGPDGVFEPASYASIQADSVVLAHDKITQIRQVRYGWADDPKCNLYNKEELPAIPFRTERIP